MFDVFVCALLFKTEVLNILTFLHRYCFVSDEQSFEITVATHIVFTFELTAEKIGVYYDLEKYVIFGHLLTDMPI